MASYLSETQRLLYQCHACIVDDIWKSGPAGAAGSGSAGKCMAGQAQAAPKPGIAAVQLRLFFILVGAVVSFVLSRRGFACRAKIPFALTIAS